MSHSLPDRLPIDDVLSQLTAVLRREPCLVLRAPTGAGKTTRVPPAMLESSVAEGKIVVLEPRRLAARAAARRMAAERGTALGGEVGYQVRFDRCCGANTRIVVVTPGILLRMLQDDAYLESVSAVVFDEFHERSLDSDLALGMVRRVQQTVRPELRLVAMSATLAVDAVAAYLGGCPVVECQGRQHPVTIRYEPRPHRQPWPEAVALAVDRLLGETPGDLLAFLPGLHEIRQTARQLEPLAAQHRLLVQPLYGDLPAEQQDAALLRGARRKIVLATNVAETSVTVEGITGVVDTGLAKVLVFDTSVGLDRLQATPISRASADQRAGRAGRTAPGVCLRLWSETSLRLRPAETEPEIRRVDLAGAVLQLLCWGEADPLQFPWLEPPPAALAAEAFSLLRLLAAVDEQGVTDLGRRLAALPVHPRLARLLVEGERWGQARRAALAAALLSERDPFSWPADLRTPSAGRAPSPSDVLDRVEALERFERDGRCEWPLGQINRGAARFTLRAADQLQRLLAGGNVPAAAGGKVRPSHAGLGPDEALLRSLLAAFPDRVARRRAPGSRKGVMVGGRGMAIAPSSAVSEPEFFLCVDVDASQSESLVRQASAIERAWLPADQVRVTTEVHFDPETEQVAARRRVRYADLLLEESPAPLPGGPETARILAQAAAERLERLLPADDSEAGQFLARVRSLNAWMPELRFPTFDETDFRELLAGLCAARRSLAEVRAADWLAALQGRLDYVQRQALDREAPQRMLLPSGNHVPLFYQAGRPPVLAARVQELFGLHDTPRVAAGRVKVLLHLLAPNYRPQQITDDLASFWTNTYPQVRKDLRARYPKHAWPEDPWTAQAPRRADRRGSRRET